LRFRYGALQNVTGRYQPAFIKLNWSKAAKKVMPGFTKRGIADMPKGVDG